MTTPHNNENSLSQQAADVERKLTEFVDSSPPSSPTPSEHRYRSPPTCFIFKTMEDKRTWTRTPCQGISHDVAICPTCGSVFHEGYYHRADMKLYDHMGRGKGHRRERNEIEWTF